MLVILQNSFLETHQQSESPQRLPVHLLMHTSVARYLLESNPFCFDSYIYAQTASDATPVEFNLDRLSQQLSHNIASKPFITNTILDMHKDFCYKPDEAQMHEQSLEGHVQLPSAFAVPLSTQQLTLLQTHCSHAQLEELQQASSSLTAICELAAAQQGASHSAQELLPTGLIYDAVVMLTEDGQDQQTPTLHHRPGPGFFNQHELQLAHLQPVRDFVVEQYQQQGYQFADVSPLLKAPLPADAASALRLRLTQGCTHSPDKRQDLQIWWLLCAQLSWKLCQVRQTRAPAFCQCVRHGTLTQQSSRCQPWALTWPAVSMQLPCGSCCRYVLPLPIHPYYARGSGCLPVCLSGHLCVSLFIHLFLAICFLPSICLARTVKHEVLLCWTALWYSLHDELWRHAA